MLGLGMQLDRGRGKLRVDGLTTAATTNYESSYESRVDLQLG